MGQPKIIGMWWIVRDQVKGLSQRFNVSHIRRVGREKSAQSLSQKSEVRGQRSEIVALRSEENEVQDQREIQ